MAKLDFPSSPTFNQRYPDPAVPGIPVYTWDLEKWVASGPVGSPPQAPFDAMMYNNIAINGGFEVSQELGTGGTGIGYVRDGWGLHYVGTMSLSSGTTTGNPLPGFQQALYVNVNTAQPTLGADDRGIIHHKIEGYRTSRLMWGTANARPITIAFWSAHTQAGVYSISAQNYIDRCYVAPYTQAVSSVWQYNVITIPGDTTGTWATSNTVGIGIHFSLGNGTNTTTSSTNTWLTGVYEAASGQVNVAASTSNQCFFAGVVILPGTQAPTAAQSPNIMRPYGEELTLCLRYFERITLSVRFSSPGNGYGPNFPLVWFPKRTIPGTTSWGGTTNDITTIQINPDNFNSGSLYVQVNASGDSYFFGREFALDSRL